MSDKPLNPALPADWAETWAARQRMAQLVTHTTSVGVPYARTPYGDHAHDLPERCTDCGVTRGLLHVPGCLNEVCPVCGGQVGCGHQDVEREAP